MNAGNIRDGKKTSMTDGAKANEIEPPTMPTADYWAGLFAAINAQENTAEDASKEHWNAKAPGFTHKRTRSGYLGQLIDRLALKPEESVFDMGCGPGTLAIPLAQAGHRVVAVDFSDAMLAELDAAAREAGPKVAALIETHERSWADAWDDLPTADVAVASRSLITRDLPDAIEKLEGRARSRVVITVVAGEMPMADLRMLRSLGRDVPESRLRTGMAALVNYLFAIGRRPKTDYLAHARRWHAESRNAMVELAASVAKPQTDAERGALAAFVDEHASRSEETGEFVLDYDQQSCWGYVEWDVPGSR